MPSVEYDLRYLEAGLLDLEGYLLSQEQYWPIGVSAPRGDPPYPRLTLGEMLLARTRLQDRALNSEQRERFQRLEQKMDSTHAKWKSAWEQKAAHGFSARLKLWRDFLEDYRDNPGENGDRYAYEVRRRAMIDLLKEQFSPPPQELEMLAGLDAILRKELVPGSFVWDKDLQSNFPISRFWYLYGHLKNT